jgi:hypothetical protein
MLYIDQLIIDIDPCMYIYVFVYLDICSGLSISRFEGGGETTASVRSHTCHTNVA